jgi:hypothetical protein
MTDDVLLGALIDGDCLFAGIVTAELPKTMSQVILTDFLPLIVSGSLLLHVPSRRVLLWANRLEVRGRLDHLPIRRWQIGHSRGETLATTSRLRLPASQRSCWAQVV